MFNLCFKINSRDIESIFSFLAKEKEKKKKQKQTVIEMMMKMMIMMMMRQRESKKIKHFDKRRFV